MIPIGDPRDGFFYHTHDRYFFSPTVDAAEVRKCTKRDEEINRCACIKNNFKDY